MAQTKPIKNDKYKAIKRAQAAPKTNNNQNNNSLSPSDKTSVNQLIDNPSTLSASLSKYGNEGISVGNFTNVILERLSIRRGDTADQAVRYELFTLYIGDKLRQSEFYDKSRSKLFPTSQINTSAKKSNSNENSANISSNQSHQKGAINLGGKKVNVQEIASEYGIPASVISAVIGKKTNFSSLEEFLEEAVLNLNRNPSSTKFQTRSTSRMGQDIMSMRQGNYSAGGALANQGGRALSHSDVSPALEFVMKNIAYQSMAQKGYQLAQIDAMKKGVQGLVSALSTNFARNLNQKSLDKAIEKVSQAANLQRLYNKSNLENGDKSPVPFSAPGESRYDNNGQLATTDDKKTDEAKSFQQSSGKRGQNQDSPNAVGSNNRNISKNSSSKKQQSKNQYYNPETGLTTDQAVDKNGRPNKIVPPGQAKFVNSKGEETINPKGEDGRLNKMLPPGAGALENSKNKSKSKSKPQQSGGSKGNNPLSDFANNLLKKQLKTLLASGFSTVSGAVMPFILPIIFIIMIIILVVATLIATSRVVYCEEPYKSDTYVVVGRTVFDLATNKIIPDEIWTDCIAQCLQNNGSFGDAGGNFQGVGAQDIACLSSPRLVPEPELRALMRAVSFTEGASDFDGYFRINGDSSARLDEITAESRQLSIHPGYKYDNIGILNGSAGRNGSSDATGRYQFLSTTYVEDVLIYNIANQNNQIPIAKGFEGERWSFNGRSYRYWDFSPKSQDLVMSHYLRSIGAVQKLQQGVDAIIADKTMCKWTSFPGCKERNDRTELFTDVLIELYEEEKSEGCGSNTAQIQQRINAEIKSGNLLANITRALRPIDVQANSGQQIINGSSTYEISAGRIAGINNSVRGGVLAHNDLIPPSDGNIYSPFNGKVIAVVNNIPENGNNWTTDNPSFGNYITIQISSPSEFAGRAYAVGHIGQEISVEAGDTIQIGQLIGKYGGGSGSGTGPHYSNMILEPFSTIMADSRTSDNDIVLSSKLAGAVVSGDGSTASIEFGDGTTGTSDSSGVEAQNQRSNQSDCASVCEPGSSGSVPAAQTATGGNLIGDFIDKRPKINPKVTILHYTVANDVGSRAALSEGGQAEGGYHFGIASDGSLDTIVPLDTLAEGTFFYSRLYDSSGNVILPSPSIPSEGDVRDQSQIDVRFVDRYADGADSVDLQSIQYGVYYDIQYGYEKGTTPTKTINDAQLRTLAQSISGIGHKPDQIYTHWAVQPQSKSDPWDWITPEAVITPQLLKFVQYMQENNANGWNGDPESIARSIVIQNIQNAIYVIEDDSIPYVRSYTTSNSTDSGSDFSEDRGRSVVGSVETLKAELRELERLSSNPSSSNLAQNIIQSVFGGIEANAQDARPTQESELTDEHKEFLDEIAKTAGYKVKYQDAGLSPNALQPEAQEAFDAFKSYIANPDDGKYDLNYNIELIPGGGGYRSVTTQFSTFFNPTKEIQTIFDSSEGADNTQARIEYLLRAESSAPPGYSEHHTGYAFDYYVTDVPDTINLNRNNWVPELEELVDDEEFLREKFGLKLSFPKNSTEGAEYEPWHLVYIGKNNENPIAGQIVGAQNVNAQGQTINPCNYSSRGISNLDSPFITEGTMTSPWASTAGRSGPHKGIDIGILNSNDPNPPIVALEDGIVDYANYQDPAIPGKGYGLMVIVNHPQAGLQTAYAHFKQLKVKKGQEVKKGTLLGYMGTTGSSSGVHLHFETRRLDPTAPSGTDGVRFDPCEILGCDNLRGETFKPDSDFQDDYDNLRE